MKWISRCFWLAAWGVWLWLGFGLYRELPRRIGPEVCRLPLNPGEKFIEFIPNAQSLVTDDFDASRGRQVFRRRSVLSGDVEFALAADDSEPDRWAYGPCPRLGLLIVSEALPDPFDTKTIQSRGKSNGEVRAISLLTGERWVFPDLGTLAAIHEERPWAIFFRNVGTDKRVVVIDLRTGNRLVEKTILGAGWENLSLPSFIGGDCFVVPIPDGKGDTFDEVHSVSLKDLAWRIPGRAAFVKASDDGKIAWYEGGDGSVHWLEVRDLSDRKLLLKHVPLIVPRTAYSIEFTPDHRRVLSPGTGALIDFESGKPLWVGARNELVRMTIPPNYFEVEERWTVGFGSWSTTFDTFALRSMNDGSFVSRTWLSTNYWHNGNYTLVRMDDVIYRLPPRVDWFFLAFCQVLLALPLVLLCTLLKWRRRRAAQRKLAEAAP